MLKWQRKKSIFGNLVGRLYETDEDKSERERKVREQWEKNLWKQGDGLVDHEFIDDSLILDQFSVDCNESMVSCLSKLYVYKNKIQIKRSGGGNVKGARDGFIYFCDVDSISIDQQGWKCGPIRCSGILRFRCKKGTPYYGYSTPEFIDDKDPRCSWPNEILFDAEYNVLMREHFAKLQAAFEEYRLFGGEPDMESTVNYYFYGDVINSILVSGNHNFNIDNSVNVIRDEILEKGGADTEVLLSILKEVNELVETIEKTKSVPKNKELFRQILSHANKYSWFYAEIVSFIGAAILQFIGKT